MNNKELLIAHCSLFIAYCSLLVVKNVCFFNSHKVWGGGEKWHYDMALRLRNKGYPVLVVTNKNSELFTRLQQESIALHQIRISNVSFLNPFKILYLRRIFKRYTINVIFLNLPSDVKVAGIAAKLAGVEKIIYRRGIALPVKNSLLNRLLLKHVITTVITNSEETRKTLLQNNSSLVTRDKITIIYNGIDLAAYEQEKTAWMYTREPGEILLGSAGRLSAEKGHQYLIELAEILKTRGIRFKVFIAGKGKLEGQLKQYAQKVGVDKNVIFLGFLENVKSLLENIDIFVLPSLYEGTANVLLEAMAARKPVVAFNVSSNPEIIVHNETGFLVEQGNITDLADHVEKLIQNEHKRKEFGINARKRVEDQFNIQRVVKDVTALIEA
jgi:glycosyltransferase involved in cell wall biosynthesis